MTQKKRLIRRRFLEAEPVPDDIEIIQVIEEEEIGRKNYQSEFAITVWCLVPYDS